jgi:hypothetical protein
MDSNLRFVTEDHVIWLAPAQNYREILCYNYDITLPMPGLRNANLATILVELQRFGKAIIAASDTYYKNTASLHLAVLNTRVVNACLKQIVGDHPQIRKLQVQLVGDEENDSNFCEMPSLYEVYLCPSDTEFDPRIMISCDKLYIPYLHWAVEPVHEQF